ncbi:hypothetical protein DSO57_1021861 [Entomophthora muscae]|uniref:Uncharacterized protein n=1 Tax=Entomophthora muscae TaxID=34485 RepID=A0ACC2RUH7_9FUNG|nr:hypothetical protein DSO57_1021861 [Entomophthora muscae]
MEAAEKWHREMPMAQKGPVSHALLNERATEVKVVLYAQLILGLTVVRIDNFLPLETQPQGRDSNPDPDFPQTASPENQWAGCLRFLGIKPPQAEIKHDTLDDSVSQTLKTEAQNKRSIKLPNGGKEIPTISFMSLKSSLVFNQEPSLEETTGQKPSPMTTPQEQKN